jgi:hypothetical protein
MGHLFKHLAVRLWITLAIGSLVILVALPPVAGSLGPGWMIIPCLGVFAIVFWLSGLIFASLGGRRLARLLKEASVWDRAGMTREADQALTRAADTVDSFFFSPLNRRTPAVRLLAKMAHVQLAQAASEPSSDAIVGAYLRHFPRDRMAAVKWLDGVLAGRALTAKSHDIAARIGAAHAEDTELQRMLAQFYLAERRTDFAALQAYRHLLEAQVALPDALLNDMADLFMAEPRGDALALGVYLAAVERGGDRQQLLPAIAACCRLIHPSPVTLPLLARADEVLADIAPARRERMALAFMPDMGDRDRRSRPKAARTAPSLQMSRVIPALVGLVRATIAGAAGMSGRLRRLLSIVTTRRAKSMLKWAAMGLFITGLAWLAINTTLHLKSSVKTVEPKPTPEPAAAPVTDPFTLQVAAYLKEIDAQRFVDQLKGQGLDAYWTRASGANKTWYQVRISHFKTKAEARAFGEELKKRQQIGDYYVANYKPPDVP